MIFISNRRGNHSQYRYSGTKNNSVEVLSQRDTLQLQRNNSSLLQPNIKMFANESRCLCLTKEAATNALENSTISIELKNNFGRLDL